MTTPNNDAGTAGTDDFSALLIDLETMAKAQAAIDADTAGAKKIKAAAAAAGVDGAAAGGDVGADDGTGNGDGDGAGAGDGTGTGDGAGGDDDETFGKAFTVRLDDGTEVDAFDGTAMMKALNTQAKSLKEELGKSRQAMTGAVVLIKSLQTTVTSQNDMIKALQADVAKIGASGSGRRAALTVHDKTGAGAHSPAEVKPSDVMAKALDLFKKGDLGGGDLRRIESHQLHGQVCPPDLIHHFPGLTG